MSRAWRTDAGGRSQAPGMAGQLCFCWHCEATLTPPCHQRHWCAHAATTAAWCVRSRWRPLPASRRRAAAVARTRPPPCTCRPPRCVRARVCARMCACDAHVVVCLGPHGAACVWQHTRAPACTRVCCRVPAVPHPAGGVCARCQHRRHPVGRAAQLLGRAARGRGHAAAGGGHVAPWCGADRAHAVRHRARAGAVALGGARAAAGGQHLALRGHAHGGWLLPGGGAGAGGQRLQVRTARCVA